MAGLWDLPVLLRGMYSIFNFAFVIVYPIFIFGLLLH